MKCPADLHAASTRLYDGLPQLTYPFHDRAARFRRFGLCRYQRWHGKRCEKSAHGPPPGFEGGLPSAFGVNHKQPDRRLFSYMFRHALPEGSP